MRLPYSAVTLKHVYLNRRRFLMGMAAFIPTDSDAAALDSRKDSPLHNLGNEKLPPKKILTSYNNFYEFGTGKDEPSKNAPQWKPDPTGRCGSRAKLPNPRRSPSMRF